MSPDCVEKMTVLRRLRIYLGLPAVLLGLLWAIAIAVHFYAVFRSRRQQGSNSRTALCSSANGTGEGEPSTPSKAPNAKVEEQPHELQQPRVSRASVRRATLTVVQALSVAKAPGSRKPRDTMIQRAIRATVIVCFVAYLTVSKEAVGSFTCIRVGDVWLLARDVSVDCDSEVGCSRCGVRVGPVRSELRLGVAGVRKHLHACARRSPLGRGWSVSILWLHHPWRGTPAQGQPVESPHVWRAVCDLYVASLCDTTGGASPHLV